MKARIWNLFSLEYRLSLANRKLLFQSKTVQSKIANLNWEFKKEQCD